MHSSYWVCHFCLYQTLLDLVDRNISHIIVVLPQQTIWIYCMPNICKKLQYSKKTKFLDHSYQLYKLWHFNNSFPICIILQVVQQYVQTEHRTFFNNQPDIMLFCSRSQRWRQGLDITYACRIRNNNEIITWITEVNGKHNGDGLLIYLYKLIHQCNFKLMYQTYCWPVDTKRNWKGKLNKVTNLMDYVWN